MLRNSNSVLRTWLCDGEVPATSLETAACPPGWRRAPVRDRGPDSTPPQEPSSSQTLGGASQADASFPDRASLCRCAAQGHSPGSGTLHRVAPAF